MTIIDPSFRISRFAALVSVTAETSTKTDQVSFPTVSLPLTTTVGNKCSTELVTVDYSR